MPNASSPKRNKPGRTQTPASPAGVLSSESVANLSTVGVLAAATAVAAVLLGLYTTSRPTTARLPPPSVPPLPVRCLDAVTTGVLACSGQLGLPGAGGPLDMCLNELDENLGLDPGAWASLAAAAGTGIGAAGRDARAKGVSAVLAGLGLTNTRGNLGRGPATSGGRALDPVMGLLQCFGLISGSGAPIRPPASLPPGIAIGVGTLQITAELAIQLPKHGKTDLAAAGVMVSRKNLGRLIERAMPQLGRPGAAMGHMLRGFTATAARKKTSRSKATQELDASYLAAVLAMAGHYPLEIVKVLVSTAAAAVSDGGEHALRWLGSTCGIGDGFVFVWTDCFFSLELIQGRFTFQAFPQLHTVPKPQPLPSRRPAAPP